MRAEHATRRTRGSGVRRPAAALQRVLSRSLMVTLPVMGLVMGLARTARTEAEPWAIPHFFEVGRQVRLAPGGAPVDTTRWIHQALDRDATHRKSDRTATADDAWKIFTYPEIDRGDDQGNDSGGAVSRRYALLVPKPRPYSTNGHTVACWEPSADAFNFGVEHSRTFGHLADLGSVGAAPVIRHLEREIQPAGANVNVQAYQLEYAIEGTDDVLWEHKGLIPELPVSFDRFRLERPAPHAGDATPFAPVHQHLPRAAVARPLALEIGLIPTDSPAWARLESIAVGGYRVLLATDGHGESYFLAAPLALNPSWYFGDVAADLVVESVLPAGRMRAARGGLPGAGPASRAATTGSDEPPPPARAAGQAAAALFFPDVVGGTVFSGKVFSKEELPDRLLQAAAFLAAHDEAQAELRAHGPEGPGFLRHYAHTFLEAHRSRVDPRALTAEAHGDAFHAVNAPEPSGGTRHGGDQARALLGLVGYQRKTNDPSVVEAIWGLAEASMEAMTPSGAVFRNRFDEMLMAEEEDTNTGRADVFIDNGAVSIGFNHRRLVIRGGAPRVAGATWGAVSMVLGGKLETVESGDYGFAIDAATIPETVRADQESLEIARLFTRRDGTLRVRETAALARGIPAARVEEEIENLGTVPRVLGEIRMTIGDFLHYGDGLTEMSQNRYGLGAVVEGERLPVGLWMEGMREPLWGDNFPPGWVDLTEAYRKYRPRFLVVHGYAKAEVYYLPQAADQLVMFNAAGGPPGGDGYRGWTTLQARYRIGKTLGHGATFRSPPVYTYLMRVPLFSADGDTVPDALQSLVPLWTDLVEASRKHRSEAALRAELAARPDRERAQLLAGLLHTTLEPDDTSIILQMAWMACADRLAELADAAHNDDNDDNDERRLLERRARLVRESAVRAAYDSLTAWTELRGRSDLMPSYGMGSNYGFHLLVFDWAYRTTGDTRFRDGVLALADQLSASEAAGGLQVTDPAKPNFGAYLLNERARAEGSNNLDDQGIKLWALRVAYERTLNPRYRRSAELFIDHWIKVRAEDHQFFGTTRLFERYVATGPDQQTTPLGQESLLIGLGAWADLHPTAARLRGEGLKYFAEPHPVDAVGLTGALDGGASGGPNVVEFATGAEVGGTFLLAMTFDPARLKGRWSAARPAVQRPARPPHTSPISAVEWAKGHPACLAHSRTPG